MTIDRTGQVWSQRDDGGVLEDWTYLVVGCSNREDRFPLWDAVVIGAPGSPKSLGNMCLLSESWFRMPSVESMT
jgi:hypothetical protein